MIPPVVFPRQALRENAVFFACFAVFLTAGAFVLLSMETGDDIFFFSARRTYLGDRFFLYATTLGEGYPFILGIIALLFVRYRYAVVVPVLGLTVSIVSNLTKRYFDHPRPYAFLRDRDLLDRLIPVPGVDMHGGMTSFPSGHAMAAFAVLGFLALCLPAKRWGGLVFFLMALATGVSRIYLVQHFLKDVYLGAILGVLIALTFHALAASLPGHRWPWLDQSLLFRRRPATLEEVRAPDEDWGEN
jgi:membrane-associated phospholipid phosphatase